MEYIVEDLDYIFIRAIDKNGKWATLSLNDILDKHFVDWIKDKFGLDVEDAEEQPGEPWTPLQKVDVLNFISKNMGGKPCVVMIKREARNK